MALDKHPDPSCDCEFMALLLLEVSADISHRFIVVRFKERTVSDGLRCKTSY